MNNKDKNHHVINKTDFGSEIGTDAAAPPQSSNEGGIIAAVDSSLTVLDVNAPRLVTRGESLETYDVQNDAGESFIVVVRNGRAKVISIPIPKADGNPNAAIVDFLNCTFHLNSEFKLNSFFQKILNILGHSFAPAIDLGRGKYGYQHSFKFGNSKALFAYGGNSNTGFLSFSGESCHQIPNWTLLVNYLEIELNARITRWDGAYDDFDGVKNVDVALSMYQDNLFNAGGRKPMMKQIGNWIEPDGRGRTLEIGSRENGKSIRIYEKGMQQGIPYHSWVRWETQLGNRDREIPWEAVLEPGKYLAGSYPKALGWISTEQTRIKTLQKTVDIGYESMTYWTSISCGKQINAMMLKEGSAEKVIEILRREGLPKRLVVPELPRYGRVMP